MALDFTYDPNYGEQSTNELDLTYKEPAPKPKRNAFAAANDTAIEAGNAAAGLAKAGVDLFAPGSGASKSIEGFIEEGQAKQSDWKKAQRQRLQDELAAATGEMDKAGTYLKHAVVEDPLGTAGQVIGNVGPFGVIGNGMKLLGGGATAANMTLAGGLTAGEVRGNIYDKIGQSKDADLIAGSPEYAALRQGGVTEADAKHRIGSDFLRNAPEVLGAGAIGALGGKFGLEGIVAGTGKNFGRLGNMVVGVADEASQGAVEQLASNYGVQRSLPGQSLMEDVALNAAAEGILGIGGGLVGSPKRTAAPAPEADPAITNEMLDAEANTLASTVDQYNADTQMPQLGYQPSVITVPNNAGGETVIDPNAGPISGAAASAVTSGAAQQVAAGSIEGGFPFASSQAAQLSLDQRADGDRLTIIPHPRVPGRFATVPKSAQELQAIDAKAFATEQNQIRQQQVETEDGNAINQEAIAQQQAEAANKEAVEAAKNVPGLTHKQGTTAGGDFSWNQWENKGWTQGRKNGTAEAGKHRIYLDIALDQIDQARDAMIRAANAAGVPIQFKVLDAANTVQSMLDGTETRAVANFVSIEDSRKFHAALRNDPQYASLSSDRQMNYEGHKLDHVAHYADGFREQRSALSRIAAATQNADKTWTFNNEAGNAITIPDDAYQNFKKQFDSQVSAKDAWSKVDAVESQKEREAARQAPPADDQAQDDINNSTGKMSLPRSPRKPGESNEAYLARRAAESNKAKQSRGIPTQASDNATLEANFPGATVVQAKDFPAQSETKGLSRQQAKIIESMASIFKKRVVFFNAGENAADGFWQRGNTIYINQNASTTPLRILGHEMMHALKSEAKASYDAMLTAVDGVLTEKELIAQFKDYFAKEEGKKDFTDEQIIEWLGDKDNKAMLVEEWMADLSGNRFAESGFWADVFQKVEDRNGSTISKNIINRMRLAIVSAINKMMKAIRGGKAFGVDARMADNLEQIRKAMAEGFAQYAVAVKTGNVDTAGEGGVKFSSAKDGRIRRTIQELVDAAESQSDWKTWYARHEDTLIQVFGEDADLFQKILSATSQATGVKGNVTLALKAYDQMLSGQPFFGYLPAVIKNLNRIKENEKLQGQKISQHGEANDGNIEAIAVDRHIAMLFFNTKSPSKVQVASAKKRIRTIADRLGWEPRQVQAALWAYNQVRLGTDPSKVESYDKIIEARSEAIAQLRAKLGRGEGRGLRVDERSGAGTEEGQGAVGRDAQGVQYPEEVKLSLARSDQRVNPSEIPEFRFSDFVGRDVFATIADRTAAGGYYTGIDGAEVDPIQLHGGPGFPELLSNYENGVIWANDGTGIKSQKERLVEKHGRPLMAVSLGMFDMHKSNATAVSAYMKTLEAYVDQGRIDLVGMRKITESIRKEKLSKEYKKDELAAFPGFDDKAALHAFIRNASFGARSGIVNVLSKAGAQKLGVPSADKVIRKLADPEYAGSRHLDTVLFLEPADTDAFINLGENGTEKHPSYAYGIKGKVVGKLSVPINAREIWGDWFADKYKEKLAEKQLYQDVYLGKKPFSALKDSVKREKYRTKSLYSQAWKLLESQYETTDKAALVAGDFDSLISLGRSFGMSMPVVNITPELAERLDAIGSKPVPNQSTVQAAISFINGDWRTSDDAVKDGGVSAADFARELRQSDFSGTLDQYTQQQLDNAIRGWEWGKNEKGKKAKVPSQKMKLYRLGNQRIQFALKSGKPFTYGVEVAGLTDNEVTLVSVVNNEPGVSGIAGPAIMTKAIEEGVTFLDCYSVPSKDYPNGFLPTLYAEYGFREVARVPFDRGYLTPDHEYAWKQFGWKSGDPLPEMALMKWEGNESDRQGIQQRYLEQGGASLRELSVRAGSAAGSYADKLAGQKARRVGRKADSAGGNQGVQDASNRASLASRAYGIIEQVKGLDADQQRNLGVKLSTKRSNASSDGRVGGRAEGESGYGAGQAGAVSVVGIHYSGAERSSLDGRYYGTGARGKEGPRVTAAKDKRLSERVYFYVDSGKGVTPEQGVGSIPHSVKLNNLYDLDADTWVQRKLDRGLVGDDRMNAFESAVIDAGFDGYVSDFGTQRAAVLLGRHNVPVSAGKPPITTGNSAGNAGNEAADRVENARNLPAGKMPGSDWKRMVPEATMLDDGKDYYKSDVVAAMRGGVKFSPARAELDAIEKRLETADAKAKPMIEKHLDQLKRGVAGEVVRDAKGNLLAPNGKKSNLDEKQYLQVRTPEFKKWFGDWLSFHNAKDGNGVWSDGGGKVSKVVDANGEPLVVYHGSLKGGFRKMQPEYGDKHRSPMVFAAATRDTAYTYAGRGTEIDLNTGLYEDEEGYDRPEDDYDQQRGVYSLFLNIRYPNEADFEGANWDGQVFDKYEVKTPGDAWDAENIYGPNGERFMDYDMAEEVAEANNGEVHEATELDENTNSVAEEAKRYGNDGAIIRRVVDNGGQGGYAEADDVFVFFNSNQAKSATQNTGAFSENDNDLRFSLKRKIDVDGIQRPVANSKGQPIASTEEGVRNFWRWFGNSKAVDADGKPLVVYHGTRDSFDEFKDGAVYFTTSSDLASVYAGVRYSKVDTGGNLMPAYIKLDKPTTFDSYMPASVVKNLKETGFDGAWNKEGKSTPEYFIVFSPTQIKSAIGNSGAFDATNPDIRYSRARGTSNWDAPAPSKMDDVIYSLQDKQIDLRRVVEEIKKAVGTIADKFNPYLQEELFHGKSAKGVTDFLDLELRPMLQEMRMRGVDMTDFEEYLWNRHAEEANRHIAKINPQMQDAGSGIKTADARAYLAGLPANKRTAFEALAKKIDAINKKSQDILVASGLEKQSTIDAWNGAYKHYVPLFREDVDGGTMGTGKGYSVRGPATKRRTGSKKAVVDIIGNIAMQRERNIVRAEKNRVGNALLGLVQSNPNPDFWSADNAPTERAVVERGGKEEVVTRVVPNFRQQDNVILTRINGEDHYVIMEETDERAMRMAQAIKNLDADQLGRVLSATSKLTRYFASVNTQFNPIFGVINLTRDVQGALMNLSTTDLKGQQSKVMGYTLSAIKGIYSDMRAHRAGRVPTSVWAQEWEEFQSVGGQTGYRDQYSNAEMRGEAIQAEIKNLGKTGLLRWLQLGEKSPIFGWLSDYNNTMENGVRLAAYRAAKENGMSKEQAASLAKNLTVNFNRKGQVATQMGAIYAFFNASVQGTARLAETLTGPAGKKIITGGLLLGSMQALLLAAAGFGDDEPPDFIRERNIIIPIGDGKYFSIPMPLGFHVIPSLSRIPTEFVLSGFKNPAKRVGDIIGLFADTFNPIGNAGISLQTIAPTIVDPFAALTENRDFSGKPIAKLDRNATDPTPGHMRTKDSATSWSKAISYGINALTGGTEFKKGLLSPTPDQLDYLIGQVTGGVGREASKLEQTLLSPMSGEELPLYKIPLVGRFVGDTQGKSAEGGKFYAAITRINEHENELKGLRESKRGEEAREYLRENPEAMLVMAGNQVEREITKLNQAKRLAKKMDNVERVKLIDQQITARMKAFNDRVKALEEKSAA